jgi:hypothetical protein
MVLCLELGPPAIRQQREELVLRLGPYSIVWFDVLAPNGTEYVSSYVSLNGSIIASSCSGIKVRPTGENSQYPPVVTSGNPEGFHIELDLGIEGVLEVDVKSTLTIADVVLYTRWIGSLSGAISGVLFIKESHCMKSLNLPS